MRIELDQLTAALNLSAEQASHLREVLERQVPPPEDGAASPPPTLAVDFHVRPSALLKEETRLPSDAPPHVAEAFAKLGPALRKRLLEIEPQVLKWIGSSRDNAMK